MEDYLSMVRRGAVVYSGLNIACPAHRDEVNASELLRQSVGVGREGTSLLFAGACTGKYGNESSGC